MKPVTKLVSGILLLSTTATLLGSMRPAEVPNVTQAYHRIDPPMRYAFRQSKTTLRSMGEFIGPTMDEMNNRIASGELKPASQPTFIYEGADGEMDSEFTLKVGVPVVVDQKAVAGFEVIELPAFESVSSVYCGPMQDIRAAYERLFQELFALGNEPTGTVRETYLHWEGESSENDITLLSVQVKPSVAPGK